MQAFTSSRAVKCTFTSVLIGLVIAVAAPAAHAAAYRTCALSERDQDPPGDVPTYNLALKRKGTSCATARKVMFAFHRCRAPSGYRCTRRLLASWTCTATKDSSTAQIFYASFTCRSGSRRVRSTYQQNT
jgi:hypothetical protein